MRLRSSVSVQFLKVKSKTEKWKGQKQQPYYEINVGLTGYTIISCVRVTCHNPINNQVGFVSYPFM